MVSPIQASRGEPTTAYDQSMSSSSRRVRNTCAAAGHGKGGDKTDVPNGKGHPIRSHQSSGKSGGWGWGGSPLVGGVLLLFPAGKAGSGDGDVSFIMPTGGVKKKNLVWPSFG